MARGESDEKATECWGQASCPLVPAALRRLAGDAPAPASVQTAFGRPLKLAELDARIWTNGRDMLDKAGLGDLVKVLTPLVRTHAGARLVESNGIAPVDAAALAVAPQTAKLVAAATQGRPIEVARLTFGDLLAMPKVGPKRTLELACALEAYLDRRDAAAGRVAPPPPQAEAADGFAATMVQDLPDDGPSPVPAPDESLIGTIVPPPGERREKDRRQAGATPREIRTFFRVLAAWASGERGEQTLQHALPQAKPGWPPELVQLWKRVRYCSAPDLAGTLRDRYSVPDLVQQAFAGCDQRHRLILQARVLTTTKPTSLEALAPALRMSVDEVRALQRAALGYLERLQTKPFRPVSGRARLIRERLGCAVPERDPVLKQALDWVVADFDEFPDLDFARELMLWLAGPYRLKERWFVISADLPIRTVQALLPHRNRDGVIEMSVVRKVLSSLAIHPKYHEAWIDRVGEFIGVANGLMLSSDRVTGRLPALPPR